MPTLTVRYLPDEVYRSLRVRAAQNGRNMEIEVHEILAAAVLPESRIGLGSLLAEAGRQARLTDEEAAKFDNLRDNSPIRSIDLD